MLGDVPPSPAATLATKPGGTGGTVVLPSTRGFKIADNESPEPRDRVYFSFNYFDNLFGPANRAVGSGLHNLRVYRESFGLEKTCLDGAVSVGLRLPLNSLSADPGTTAVPGSATDVGDLSVILKSVLWHSPDNARLVSGGLAVTAPTGPDSFAADGLRTLHETTLQPFVGFLCTRGDFYFQGFTALDVPTDAHDVTLLFNDVGVGYFLYRADACDCILTTVAPTLEVHVLTPLNHRGGFDPAHTPDLVDCTAGVNFELAHKTRLAVGVATPLTGPRPYDFEVLVQLRCRF
jgi:hypothetical protein